MLKIFFDSLVESLLDNTRGVIKPQENITNVIDVFRNLYRESGEL